MTFAATHAVASGMPYAIAEVDGHVVLALADLAGAVAFDIEHLGRHFQIAGVGVLSGSGVRFYQKDVEHDGKDIRVWQISARAGGFVAEHVAAMLPMPSNPGAAEELTGH